jgi:DinB superfamily
MDIRPRDIPDLRYPIGKFAFPDQVTTQERDKFVEQIAEAPAQMKAAVAGLSDEQLDTPYRPGGWTVRQVVHHVPDSHLNSYIRFRWALTEDAPAIKAYHEDRWAELSDARTAPVETSLVLLGSLHGRWINLLGSLTDDEWKRTFRHPELGPVSLEKNAALYAWHGQHHVAHIRNLRDRMRW